MRKQEEEALRRLEQALLEDAPEEAPAEWVDEYYDDEVEAPTRFTAENTDDVDVELDSYSEEVYRGRKGGCLIPGLVTVLALSVLAAMVLWLLRYLGVMG